MSDWSRADGRRASAGHWSSHRAVVSSIRFRSRQDAVRRRRRVRPLAGEISKFEQAVCITAAGRIYQILGDERVEQKRDEYLNLMLFNSGVASPQMITSVSSEHRRRAMDQYALFISSRASREEIQGLVEGTLRLQDLGIEEQAKTLINVALSEPILLPGMTRPLLRLPGERE